VLSNILPLDTTPPPPAAAAAQRPRPRTDGVREAGRTLTAAPAAVRRPLHRHLPLLHLFTLHNSDKEDKVSTLLLKSCTDPTAPLALPRVRGRPPASGIFPRRGPWRPAGYASPHSNQQNRAGNRFPLARRQGFLHPPPPFSTGRCWARPLPPSAGQIRPLGLRPRGLGGAL
jgi:hypothetical protein